MNERQAAFEDNFEFPKKFNVSEIHSIDDMADVLAEAFGKYPNEILEQCTMIDFIKHVARINHQAAKEKYRSDFKTQSE